MNRLKHLVAAVAIAGLSYQPVAVGSEVLDEYDRRDTIQAVDFSTRTLTVGGKELAMSPSMVVLDEADEGALLPRHESFLAPGQSIRFVVTKVSNNGEVSYSVTKIIRTAGD